NYRMPDPRVVDLELNRELLNLFPAALERAADAGLFRCQLYKPVPARRLRFRHGGSPGSFPSYLLRVLLPAVLLPQPSTGIPGSGQKERKFMMSAMTRNSHTPVTLELSGDGLTLDDAKRILHGQVERLTLAAAARKGVEESRRCLE